MHLLADPETWVAIAFVILMGLFAYLGVHRTVLKALDHRAERIRNELEEAKRLKQEADKVLADYKARRASAEREAEEIVTSAKAEAERIAADAVIVNADVGAIAVEPPAWVAGQAGHDFGRAQSAQGALWLGGGLRGVHRGACGPGAKPFQVPRRTSRSEAGGWE